MNGNGARERTEARRGETRRVLALLQERLDEARGAGGTVLRLDPADVARLCSEAGVEGDAVGAFRALVRSNLVRLRGRWREGVSCEAAPVYVARLAAPRGSREPEDRRRHGTSLASPPARIDGPHGRPAGGSEA